jgi:predicted HAD superfamily phosphohydrolase
MSKEMIIIQTITILTTTCSLLILLKKFINKQKEIMELIKKLNEKDTDIKILKYELGEVSYYKNSYEKGMIFYKKQLEDKILTDKNYAFETISFYLDVLQDDLESEDINYDKK